MRGLALQHIARALSHRITLLIGIRYGYKFPMHFVCGFPRSGTTWFSEMLANYLNLPRPRHYVLPIGFASVIHTHVDSGSNLNDCFYVIRDGRDCLVSLYFYVLKKLKDDRYAARNRFKRLFGPDFDPDDLDRYLPRFIEDQFLRPLGSKEHWGQHTIRWHQKSFSNGNIVTTRYEDLLNSVHKEFVRVLMEKYQTVDEISVQAVLERHSFEQMKRRRPDHHGTFLRKGKAGDWSNYFNLECAQIFDHYAGETLIELGYELDNSWVYQCKSEVVHDVHNE